MQEDLIELRKDAERYRWAAEHLVLSGLLSYIPNVPVQNKAGWDKAIDQAMKVYQKK